MLTSTVIRDTEQFRELKDEWSLLLEECSSACLFLTWEWMFHWWLHLAGQRKLFLVVVRRGEKVIAIAPLVQQQSRFLRLMPFRTLEFIGTGVAGSDYLSVLIKSGCEEAALREIGRVLAAANLIVELVRVDKSSLLMVNMVLQLRQSAWDCRSMSTNHSPYIRLQGRDWDSYLDTLTQSHRSDIKKKLKRLHRDFRVELRLASSEEGRKEALSTFVRLHLARWAGQGGSTAINTKELIDFHEDLSRACFGQGWLRLYTLLLDGEAVASLYIFRYGNVCYYYQAAFDPAFSKYSVGTLALALGIRQAIADGASEFDMLHDDEEYKYLWARDERTLVRYDLFPPRNIGRLARKLLALKGGLQRLRGQAQLRLLRQ